MLKDLLSYVRPGSAPLDRIMWELWATIFCGLIGLIFVAIGAVDHRPLASVLAGIGIGGLVFLAAFTGGSLIGFLFGVPRVLARETAPSSGDSTSASAQDGSPGEKAPASQGARLLQSNTNLEHVSDWLTTMIVGVSLIEFHKLNDALLLFRGFIAETATVFVSPSGHPTAGPLAAAAPVLLVIGAVCGFFYMYLNARLVLVRVFAMVEQWISTGQTLPAEQQRAVKAALAAEDGRERFIAIQLEAKRSVTVEDALSLMFDLLYKGDPQRVIELAANLPTTEAVRRPDYWFYLACAFGQKMHNAQPETDDWTSGRLNALDAARRAVTLNANYRDRLWRVSDPTASDDDLAPLRDDEEFRRLVGRGRA